MMNEINQITGDGRSKMDNRREAVASPRIIRKYECLMPLYDVVGRSFGQMELPLFA
jgi:hypothetical protein